MAGTNLIALFKQLSAKDDVLSSKQQAVLNASLLLFSEKGFDQTSTKDIASAAGVSEGTVYKHFKTKISCWLRVLHLYLKTFSKVQFMNFCLKSL